MAMHPPARKETLQARFPHRASTWQLRSTTLSFERQPLLMGVVNVTPDSFSDGGQFSDHRRAVEHGLQLAADGADILDIGGESTRPYATPVDESEELRRVVSVVQALREQTSTPLSIDTSKAKVADEAVAAGAQIINDVTGLQGDPRMVDVALATRVGICAMHMQGTPQTMQDDPDYEDVVEDIYSYLLTRRDALMKSGLAPEYLCLDPGIGFGKTHQHNLTLLANVGRYHDLGCPLLVGHSRKGFLAKVLGDKEADRTAATIGVTLALARQGIQVLRVHDVLQVKQALLLFAAAGGIDGCEAEL